MSDDWSHAACLDAPPDLFHPHSGLTSISQAVRRAAYAPAKAVCNGDDRRPPCPIRAECLAWITEHETGHGVWGGLDSSERQNLRQRSEPARARRMARADARRHSQERRDDVATLTTRGLSAAQISLRLGVTPRQVRRDRDQIRGPR